MMTSPALSQATVPFPPIGGLIERGADFEPVPSAKPSIVESFASQCVLPHPELAWAALPRHLREVPLRQMIGQLLVVSFSGKTADSAGVALAADALAASEIGGVLYFRHNVGTAEDVRAINARLLAASPDLPPMIAIDQEGGAVMRLKPSEGAPDTPSARDVAQTPPDTARETYDAMAESLASAGFTANFGPVVDLDLNPDNPVISRFGRAYGADPQTVVDYGEAFVDAHRDAGVATALKHFPGHGSSTDDSHDGATDLTPTWSRKEMIPFRDMIVDRKADMIMIGHLELDGLSGPDGWPASLSPNAIDRFLRDTLCYDGLVVSDDLSMDAVSSHWNAIEATKQMVRAGGDIALLSLSADKGAAAVREILDALEAEAAASPDFEDRIRYAYARIVHHKLDLMEARAVSEAAPAGIPTRWAQATPGSLPR
ncbi:glycoside hydrolase family 3 protein [Acuticoccus sp. M5D2P5]|uniref:glycoside hydrolase family 3 N-terminal domain-containing protein n=1 Tax=Acuticoccus kalidii TaxID=2910977 RepID=UPI001F3BCA33|nr:glycoside hydrolase family 3 N-terminal domain-containing protein [Acuticoccus kalidii]MCF3932983.1 glycoside hydrolase family 3 protein [Acuticoccus kalidii]